MHGQGIEDPTVEAPQFDPEVIPVYESIRMDGLRASYWQSILDQANQALQVTADLEPPVARMLALETTLNESQAANAGSQLSQTSSSNSNSPSPINESDESLIDTTPDLSDAVDNSPVIPRRQSILLDSSSTEDEILSQEGLYRTNDQYSR